MVKIVKNITGSPISVTDMGVTVPAMGSYTIPATDYALWMTSNDIIVYVGAGTLVINNGTVDLGKSDGIDLIKGVFPQPLVLRSGDSTDLAGVTTDKRLKIEMAFAPGSYPAYAYLSLIIGNGTDTITAGTTGYSAPIPFGGIIQGWTIAEISPSPTDSTIAVDIWKDTLLNFPPTAADKISGTQPPALSANKVAVSGPIGTWSPTVVANDCFGFTVASTDGIAKKLQITIYMTRDI